MNIVEIQDKERLYTFFKKNLCLYAYHIGDLDEFYYHYCTWYCLVQNNEIQEVILVYKGSIKPTVLFFGQTKNQKILVEYLLDTLPTEFFCHYSSFVKRTLATKFMIEPLGIHFKMMLANINKLETVNDENIVYLSTADISSIQNLFAESYPENYFTNRMLETGKYVGLKDNNMLIGIAGVHVFSKVYKIAVLGNITIHPHYRNQGFGKMLITKLVLDLTNEVEFIGLNVKANNSSAIHLYEKLGFIKCAEYEEGIVKKIQN